MLKKNYNFLYNYIKNTNKKNIKLKKNLIIFKIMEPVVINKNKLYFIYSVQTNILNNIMISDEKYKNNIILNEQILENRPGKNGEMYSILIVSNSYLVEEIKNAKITIKVVYRKNGTEDHIFLSNEIPIDKKRDNFCYNFKLKSEARWLGLKKVNPPDSFNFKCSEQFTLFSTFIKNNVNKNINLFSAFLIDTLIAYSKSDLLFQTETFCIFDQYLIENNLVGTKVHNEVLYKYVAELTNYKSFLFEFTTIFIQYLNSNKYIELKYNIIDALLRKFSFLIETNFAFYSYFLKELEYDNIRLKNLALKFKIQSMKFPQSLKSFKFFEDIYFKLLDNPFFYVKEYSGENREMEIKKLFLLAFTFLKYVPVNYNNPILFTSIAQYEVIIETYTENANYLYKQEILTNRVFPVINYNDIIRFLNGKNSLDNLNTIYYNRNRVSNICIKENKYIHIDEPNINLINQFKNEYKKYYISLNQFQLLNKINFIEWGNNLLSIIDNENDDNNNNINNNNNFQNQNPNNYPNQNNNYPQQMNINNSNLNLINQPKIENSELIQGNNVNLYPNQDIFSKLPKIKYIHEERFVNGFPEELLIEKTILDTNYNLECEICLCLLNYPISCSQCNKNFCRKCIGESQEKSNKCPNCREIFQGININNETLNILNNINLKCYHYNEGCNQIISYINYINHLKNCDFGEYECPFEDCKYIGLKKDMNFHIEKCALMLIKCSFCLNKYPKINMNEHKVKCGENLIQCELCFQQVKMKNYISHKNNKCINSCIICFNCFVSFSRINFIDHNEFMCIKILFKTFKRDYRIERGRRMYLEEEVRRLNDQITDLRRKLNSYSSS